MEEYIRKYLPAGIVCAALIVAWIPVEIVYVVPDVTGLFTAFEIDSLIVCVKSHPFQIAHKLFVSYLMDSIQLPFSSYFSTSTVFFTGEGAKILIPFSPFLTFLSKLFFQDLKPATYVACGICIMMSRVLL